MYLFRRTHLFAARVGLEWTWTFGAVHYRPSQSLLRRPPSGLEVTKGTGELCLGHRHPLIFEAKVTVVVATNWLPLENGSSFQNTSKHFKTHIFINFSLYSFSHTIDLGMAFSAFEGSECCSVLFHITQERIFSLQIVMIFTFALLAVWFQILLTFYFLSLFKKYRFALAWPDFTLR